MGKDRAAGAAKAAAAPAQKKLADQKAAAQNKLNVQKQAAQTKLDTQKQGIQKATGAAQDIYKKGQQVTGSVTDKGRQAVQQVQEKTKGPIDDMRNKYNLMKEKGQDKYNAATNKAAAVAKGASQGMQQAGKSVADFSKENVAAAKRMGGEMAAGGQNTRGIAEDITKAGLSSSPLTKGVMKNFDERQAARNPQDQGGGEDAGAGGVRRRHRPRRDRRPRPDAHRCLRPDDRRPEDAGNGRARVDPAGQADQVGHAGDHHHRLLHRIERHRGGEPRRRRLPDETVPGAAGPGRGGEGSRHTSRVNWVLRTRFDSTLGTHENLRRSHAV